MTLFRKRKPTVGARPGTLNIPQDGPPPAIRVIVYRADGLEELDVPEPEQLLEHLNKGDKLWVDVQGLGDGDVLRAIADIFELHLLLLEDVVHVPQRPKTEAYEQHHFFVTRMMMLPDSSDSLEIEQVSIVLGRDYVLTFQERPGDVLEPVRERLRQARGPIRKWGSDYLAYSILDTIIDNYYPIVESVGDRIEALEDEVLTTPNKHTIRRLSRMRTLLLQIRRAIWAQREALNRLVRDGSPLIDKGVIVYFRDTYDHCVQTAEVTETYREMVSGLMNTYLSAVSNRMNEVMKVLTIMASIFIPLTFVAGIYGMNFDNMPELHRPWAYPFVLSLMVSLAALMIWYFKRKGWIGADSDAADDQR